MRKNSVDLARVCLTSLLISACGGNSAFSTGTGGVVGTSDTVGVGTGSTWTNRTAGTAAAWLPWAAVASDSTGTHLVAVTYEDDSCQGDSCQGDIWTSADMGATWTNRTKGTPASVHRWRSVASDSTGNNLVAVTYVPPGGWNGPPGGGDVWTSADAGATWNKRISVTSAAGYVAGPTVASDSTGTHLFVVYGDIWASTDAGATWTDQTVGTSFAGQVDIASDSTGTHLIAVPYQGDIWTSMDSGATWINQTVGTAAPGCDWRGVASDATGTHLVAVCTGSSGGDIWVSTDSGTTWTNRTQGTAASGGEWAAVASDTTGAHLVATSSPDNEKPGNIWTSADSGMTWANETTGTTASDQVWVAVASDATGSHLVAISWGPGGSSGPCCEGNIWTNQ